MSAAERRKALLKALRKRKREKIENLAFEFEVCVRAIEYDIEILSLSEPIYTEKGPGGGVCYAAESGQALKRKLSEEQVKIIKNTY